LRKWVTVFAGARDSYQAAIALHESGLLQNLVTDWYSPLDTPPVRMISPALPDSLRSLLTRRYSSSLPSSVVFSLPQSMLTLPRSRADLPSWPQVADSLGRAAGRLAHRTDAGILAYIHTATEAFKAAGSTVPKILFQVHPHPASVKRILLEDNFLPDTREEPLFDEVVWPAEWLAKYSRECHAADLCIASSEHTKQTLVENGIDPSRVKVIPYGVDLDRFQPGVNRPMPGERFRVVFAGQMVRRKGIHYLLEAWKRLGFRDAELRLVGRGAYNQAILGHYEGCFTMVGAVGSNALVEEFRSSDVFCMPSLTEGFGLVYLEALAAGTPVIATDNTGAADIVTDGQEGFVIPPRDIDALMACLEYCYKNRSRLREMRSGARRRAEQFTWQRFRSSLSSVVRDLDWRPAA